ncbi:MAG: Alpha/Beta hydrolase protein [Monoraphidium minutum]|nr:MAG: Alpha/Beta hydrolase protein [Monoraphidium minutum]
MIAAVALFLLVVSASCADAAAPVPPPGGWRVAELARGARGAYMLVPPTYAPGKPSPLVVLLHGAGKGAADAAAALSAADFDSLKGQRALLLIPESRGTTWDAGSSAPFRQDLPLIASSLQQAFRGFSVDARRVSLFGFSDGATYALSIGLGGPRVFGAVAAVAPGGFLPPAQGTAGGAPPRVLVAHGTKDGLFPIGQTSRKIVPQLKTVLPKGAEVKYIEFDGGHEVTAGVSRQAVEWLLKQ